MAPPGTGAGTSGWIPNRRTKRTWKETNQCPHRGPHADHDAHPVAASLSPSVSPSPPRKVEKDGNEEEGEEEYRVSRLPSSPRPYCVFCGALQLQWCLLGTGATRILLLLLLLQIVFVGRKRRYVEAIRCGVER